MTIDKRLSDLTQQLEDLAARVSALEASAPKVVVAPIRRYVRETYQLVDEDACLPLAPIDQVEF